MTSDEWLVVSGKMADWFTGDFGLKVRESYGQVLMKRFTRNQVVAACELLLERGQVFLPKPGEIIQAVRELEDSPLPSWSEAWSWIGKAIRRGGRVGGTWPRKEEAALAFLEEHDLAIVARFMQSEGYVTLATTEYGDPDYGPLRVREVEQHWNDFVGVAKERLERGLALQTVRRGTVGPSKLSEAALLPERTAGRPRELEAGE
jgi:hypothetical protein